MYRELPLSYIPEEGIMTNIFTLARIMLAIAVEANKAGRKAFAAQKEEILETLAMLRKEFDEAVVDSLISAAFAQVMKETRATAKDWTAFKKEAREALNMKAEKEVEEPENQ